MPVFFAYAGVQLFNRRKLLTIVAALVPLVIAGPWYMHNYRLYGSFTGTQQAVAGIGIAQVLSAVTKIPWASSTVAFLHWSLWTGNWSFLSFSKATLNAELMLAGIGIGLYFVRFRRITRPEWWCLAACALFIVGLIYQTCATYVHTGGASLFAEPWYWQGVICFLWVIMMRGLAYTAVLGRLAAIAAVVLTTWVTVVTYVAKLLPMYGSGFERATMAHVWSWWTAHPTQDLRTVTLAAAGRRLRVINRSARNHRRAKPRPLL